MSRFGRGLGALVVTATLSAGVVAATPAVAGAPQRTHDTVDAVFVAASDGGDRALDIAVTRSDTAGAFVYATLYGGPAGDFLAEGSATSVWTDTTFRTEVELFDDYGKPAGRVTIDGTYALTGESDRYTQKFNDGNVHVLMDHTTTSVAVSDVTVRLDDTAWDITSADGFHEVGYLFVSDPATYVAREAHAVFGESTVENIDGFSLDGPLDDLGIDIDYADAEAHAAGGIDLSTGRWDGTLRLFDDEGTTLGEVTASATLTPTARTVRLFDRVHGGFERWTVTPYELVVTVDGPTAPATLTIEVAEIRYAVHTSPIG